jgi:hypothetical protein
MSPAIRDLPNLTIASHKRHSLAACVGWSAPTDLEVSKVNGSYADHNNKITVAGCARDRACDPLGIAAMRDRSDLGAHCIYKLGARKVAAARSSEVQG